MSWLQRQLQRVFGKSGGGGARGGFGPFMFAGASNGGVMTGAWTDSRIEHVRHFKHWVYIAVTRIAEKAAQMQPMVSVVRDVGPQSRLVISPPEAQGAMFSGQRLKALTQLQERERLEPVEEDHRLVRLFRDANDQDTSYDLWYETNMYLDLTGSAYWWTPKDSLNLPTEIWVIPSHWMWPIVGKNRLIEGYEMRPLEGRHYNHVFPVDEIIHLKCKNPQSKIDGYASLTAGSQWVDSSESVDRSVWHSYRNGVLPQLQIELDPQIADPDDLLLERIHARIMSRYGGERNTNRPLVLPPGWKAKPLNIMPSELHFGESADRLRDNILALYGVPKAVAGLVDNMTYGAILSAMCAFTSFKINPRLVYLGQVLTEKLARQFDPKLRVWWPDATPEDPTNRERELLTDIKAQAITRNELRALRGRAPWPPEIGDLIAGEADMRNFDHGSGNRNPDYQSEQQAESDREGNRERD